METEYSERESQPEKADRGKILDALAGDRFWVFVTAELDLEGNITLKLETGPGVDAHVAKGILIKTVEALP